MSKIKNHSRYLFIVVPALAVLFLIGLSAFNKAFSGPSDESLTVLTEADFTQDHALFAVADENIVAVFLESPSAEVENSDTGGIGYDVIPYRYRESMKQTFCWQDADQGAGHYMSLIDTEGNEVLKVAANGDCVTRVIEPGDYEMRLYHDGQTDKRVAVFIVTEENKSTLSTTSEEALSNVATFLDTNRCAGCDLSGVNLFKADLSGVDLSDAILNDAILTEANLSDADLSGAELRNADLSQADLTGADLTGADLSGAILISADMTDANLLEANLENADTKGAILTNTSLTGTLQTKSTETEADEELTVLKVDDDTCASGTLDPGDGTKNLLISAPCNVGSGVYQYLNVNIIQNGVLNFQDDGGNTHFWAESILVEKGGSLTAGDNTMAGAFGANGGTLTIHLYGSASDKNGIGCRSPKIMSESTCGIPYDIWTSNIPDQVNPASCTPNDLPGPVNDCFYQYQEPDPIMGETGYFGNKVLAVSYGGTIQLYGQKGATYGQDLENSDSGKSWVRLNETVGPDSEDPTTLKLSSAVDWGVGDRVVVTTTDYLPGHSELLEITEVVSTQEIKIKVIDPFTGMEVPGGVQYRHNGSTFPLSDAPDRLMLNIDAAETRAAVALLSRSIRVVSGGDTIPADSDGKMCKYDCFPTGDGFYGGHTMIRQGAEDVKIQGVEFYRLGQGGRKGRYPVHMHLLRKTPQTDTNPPESVFMIEDNSVYESMTRWYTLHGTQGVTLKRNVGYLSIGHGYYIEDGTETDNKFYSNIGIFARAAVDNAQNPRQVPGILAWTADKTVTPAVPYHSDYAQPTVFWIMNGWNDFEYNMAVGANACGACYWWVPGAISGPSQKMKWDGYAGQQFNRDVAGRTPLKNFKGNYCSTAMTAFNTTGDISPCLGVGGPAPPNPVLEPVTMENIAPAPNGNLEQESYYPKLGNLHLPTKCSNPSTCSTVSTCSASNRENCVVSVIDRFTTAFNWTETNFAAVWLRPQWYLVINSVISDVQNAGLTFVTGGDYTESNFVPGQWQLARQNAFIGQTQPNDSYFALDHGPVNKNTNLTCENLNLPPDNPPVPVGNYCLLRDEGISFPLSNFANNQRLFNIYDGPSFEDSNAFFNVKKTFFDNPECNVGQGNCVNSSKSMYARVQGMPYDKSAEKCFLPNAAIAWKQPNGFYYPPAFHSSNLYFRDSDVDIRHFVIEPLFTPNVQYAFQSDDEEVKKRYCTFALNNPMGTGGSFGSFSAIDRQTILNDDDGSLTGFRNTISVNEDDFFKAPTEEIECRSEETAKTSPYEYVTTVVYPGCVANEDCGGHCAVSNNICADNSQCNGTKEDVCLDTYWTDDCGSSFCYGVPLYRQFLTKDEASNNKGQEIRMMGMNFFQRSNLTANHGVYYIDTTVSKQKQLDGLLLAGDQKPSLNVFKGGQTYYVLLIFAKNSTRQTYRIYVGDNFNPQNDVQAVRSTLKSSRPLNFSPQQEWPDTWTRKLSDDDPNVLEVTIDLTSAEFKDKFDKARMDRCKPEGFCKWSGDAATGTCGCSEDLMNSDPKLYEQCMKQLGDDKNTICDWAVRAVDCPEGGCYGFSFKLANDPPAEPVPPPAPCCFPDNSDWNVKFTQPITPSIAGVCQDPNPPKPDFCTIPKCTMNVGFPPQGPQPTDEPEPPQATPPPSSEVDTDGDGVNDDVDVDADNDGIPNDAEKATDGTSSLSSTRLIILADPDGDGIPNELDLDSDGDGLTDHAEAGGTDDANGDGRADNFTDADMDGLNDAYEPSQGGTPLPLPDTDGDGIPDFLDSVNNVGDGGSDEGGSDNTCAIAGADTGKSGLAGLLIYALIPAAVFFRKRIRRSKRG